MKKFKTKLFPMITYEHCRYSFTFLAFIAAWNLISLSLPKVDRAMGTQCVEINSHGASLFKLFLRVVSLKICSGEVKYWFGSTKKLDLYTARMRIIPSLLETFWFWLCLSFKSNKVCLVSITDLTVVYCTSIRPNSKELLPSHCATSTYTDL